MPAWIADTLATTPAFAAVYLGLGSIWALALLPRADWRLLPVGALAFIAGPALLTAWMFILGTLGASTEARLLRPDLIALGGVVMAPVGAVIVWRRARGTAPPERSRVPLRFDERLLIALIAAALLVRWFVTAYWPFIAYDTLWVYGYQGRLYSLLGHIPNTIDYYPQFLSLQYTFGQIVYGAVNDHAARAVIPFINLGSILAVYVLGEKIAGRRVGVYAAALWALYPHVAEWSRMGDLEIALAGSFSLATAYFLAAWQTARERPRDSTHYALLAGFALGVALWTKPTAGAFVWGVGVLLVVQVILARLERPPASPLPWVRVVFFTGLASAPLGGVWYIRNFLLGHAAVDFPPAFWLTQAMRSGAEFGWPLLAMSLFTLDVLARRRHGAAVLLGGLVLTFAGALPSILTPRRMEGLEWVTLAAGAALWLWGLMRASGTPSRETIIRLLRHPLAAALLLAVPYFITWFWSYSYHYRLSFAIVPLLLLPSAVLIERWGRALLTEAGPAPRVRALAAAFVLVALALPAALIPLYDGATGWDALWSGELPDDIAKQRSGNAALLNVVDGIQAYIDANGEPPVVIAPGVETLPFFFPLADIRIEDVPTRLEALEGADYFIDSHPQGSGRYEAIPIVDNQVLGALRREDIMRRAWGLDDGIFRYDVYELNLDRRRVPPQPVDPADGEVIFGGFARFIGHDLGALDFWVGRPVYLTLYWEPLAPVEADYTVYVHLRDPSGTVVRNWDAPAGLNPSTVPPRYYSTRVWEPGEFISDVRVMRLQDPLPLGPGYSLVIGLYDLATGERMPVTVNGVPVGDGVLIDDRFSVLESPE